MKFGKVGVFLVVLGLLFLRFLLALPVKTRNRIIISAAIFLGGAVGVEMVEAIFVEKNGGDIGIPIVALIQLEEFMEMFGIAYFIYAIFEFMYEVGPRKTTIDLIIENQENRGLPSNNKNLPFRPLKYFIFFGTPASKK